MDYRNPDYAAVFTARLEALKRLRAEPDALPALKAYYGANPATFISDWGVTWDPRLPERGLPSLIPFVLFDRQHEWIDWVMAHWIAQKPGLTEKSRDFGLTWLAAAFACTTCLFREGIAIGFGSRLVDYVDKIGTMKPILPKCRMFMENLPVEFRGGWVSWRDAPYMRINFPETGSIITGEGGDQIGRGDRTSIYFIDESAYLERADLVERSLSQTTNCRIDVSSVNGMNNAFAKKRHEGKVDVFVCDWRDDPRKDDAWYAKQCSELDPVTVAQEIDRDYSASVEGIVIPGAWVRASIDATKKLGIAPSGLRGMSLDVADEGVDKNAACCNYGIEIEFVDEWSGKGGDIFSTVQRAFLICEERDHDGFRYDADGLGAGVRGDARVINAMRAANGQPPLLVEGFRGSDAVFEPEAQDVKGRKNKDLFANRKSQGWWNLRVRFQKVYRWIVEGVPSPPDEIISISSKCPMYFKLVAELSQPTFTINQVGKILINKKPDGMKSPNLADAAMIRYAPNAKPGMKITAGILAAVRGPRRR